jgi:hypothetical protein
MSENKISELGVNIAYTQGYRDAFNSVKCPYNKPVSANGQAMKKAWLQGRRDAKRF